MKQLLIELPWPPSVNSYYRHVGRRVLISRKGREYRRDICAIISSLHIKTFVGDLEMIVDAYPPDNRRRDLDNIQKSLWDSLQHAGVYKDDSQIKDFACHMREPFRPCGKVIVRVKPKCKV